MFGLCHLNELFDKNLPNFPVKTTNLSKSGETSHFFVQFSRKNDKKLPPMTTFSQGKEIPSKKKKFQG
ncbi:MAG: hypothetical protein A2W90_19795 [Bacteroidetes bacterium GWF2_42_66]|nr:MAG: hypothetical protein A2W92_13275 [Bacteroidetes bacterium GWA2_42_15]OFX98369.1 MAG: hypothetical protein A2W89_08160 [Bacteroidetes bacterium GWE2_42_39]OFY42754.1 MAG: hypothetical protein A2W90_19795 [Bacteroidetes bacterium GWF2_42_66]HBL74367.1 hypothetical protein [Prolixibacteraceae bacterium]HCR91406.1 hypothetical protein [Prolixibacteraceae bacterium]